MAPATMDLERDPLLEAHRTAADSEHVAIETLLALRRQREQLQGMNNHLDNTAHDLNESNRLVREIKRM